MSRIKISDKLGRAIAAAVRNNQFEFTEDGQLLLSKSKLMIGGYFPVEHIRDGQVIYREDSRNIVVNEGLNYDLAVALANGSQITAWYVALFAGNVTPSASLTGANFTATTTEFTNYTESTRQVWTPGDVANQSVDNSAAKAAFTIGTGGGSVYGAALLSAPAKSAVTGIAFAASRFSVKRDVLEGDLLNVGYAIGATST